MPRFLAKQFAPEEVVDKELVEDAEQFEKRIVSDELDKDSE